MFDDLRRPRNEEIADATTGPAIIPRICPCCGLTTEPGAKNPKAQGQLCRHVHRRNEPIPCPRSRIFPAFRLVDGGYWENGCLECHLNDRDTDCKSSTDQEALHPRRC